MSTPPSSIPSNYQNANPLLYTFRDYHTGIQPYFVIISQFLFFELSLRIWNRAVYDTWLLPSEFIIFKRDKARVIYTGPNSPRHSLTISTIYIFQECKKVSIQTTKKAKLPTFDLRDILLSVLPLLGHTIWYCIVQSTCMSDEYATTWTCYNLFGYRIYNYIFDGYTDFAKEFIAKLILMSKNKGKVKVKDEEKQTWRKQLTRIIFYISLSSSTITFIFVGALILPYLVTNAIPMIFTYLFMVIIYIYIVVVIIILVKFFTFATVSLGSKEKSSSSSSWSPRRLFRYRRRLICYAAIRLFPYLMSVLFNLSQYLYFGDDYWNSITREADSREPNTYFERLVNSPYQIGHTILSLL